MQTRRTVPFALAAALVGAAALPSDAAVRTYREVVAGVAEMVNDGEAQEAAGKRGLQILNVMWEDTGRWLGSSVGPNISDVTIEVQAGKETFLMPVIRFPNFTDKTADIDIDKFYVRVGNQREGAELRTITLRELLAHPTEYMSLPDKGRIKGGSLLAKRDHHVLVSAQAAFLPIKRTGQTTFWPVIFNYQSTEKNPAVLTILVTREGTSMTIIDNDRDTIDGSWGQRLFFNAGGQRAPLIAERKSDVMTKGVTANGQAATSLGEDANVLMLIQVPLKYREPPRRAPMMALGAPMADGAGSGGGYASRGRSDVEEAVIGHGPKLGKYTELAGLTIERDRRFPIRVTVQFYQATSNGVLSRRDVARFASQIRKVYRQGDYVGSLVVPDGPPRPTMWDNATVAPLVSWVDFPGLVERYHKHGYRGLLRRR